MTKTKPLTCEEVRELLFRYDDLNDEERRAADAHLSECDACREEMESVNAMLEDLSALPEEEMPEITMRRTIASLRRQKMRSRLVRYGSAAAAVLLFAGIGIWAAGHLRMGSSAAGGALPAAGAKAEDVPHEVEVPQSDGIAYGEDNPESLYLLVEGMTSPEIRELLPSGEVRDGNGWVSALLTREQVKHLLSALAEKGTVRDVDVASPDNGNDTEEGKKKLLQDLREPAGNPEKPDPSEWELWIRDIFGDAEKILVEIQLDE